MAKTYVFNPDNDLALANGDANYLPPRTARRMAMDLAFLPAWYADEGDTVLLPDSDALYYWEKTSVCNVPHAQVEWMTQKETLPNQPLVPWGWNPALVKQMSLRGLADKHLPTQEQMRTLRHLSSRKTSVEVLEEIMRNISDKYRLVGESAYCTTEEEIARQVEAHPSTMLKAPWSSSGKGLRRGQGHYIPPLSGWCVRTLQQQGAVVVEPLYRKVNDFAMEFYSTGNGDALTFVGYSRFVTDANGAYEGNVLATDEEIERELSTYVSREALHAVCAELQASLTSRIGACYRGYVGVDMMICLTSTDKIEHAIDSHLPFEEQAYALHPCVEVNLRMNMGVVAHIFHERYVASGCRGQFMVEYFPTPEALKEAHRQRTEESPLLLDSDGRIRQGYQPLTPIGRETQYLAWVLIS